MTTTEHDEASNREYTIDEISSLSRVPSRTIRFYQSRGALMAPAIRGRVAYYGPKHLAAARAHRAAAGPRAAASTPSAICLASIDKGETDLAEWLGVEQQLQASWAQRPPAHRDRERALRAGGDEAPRAHRRPPARARLLERRGEVLFLLSPALLARRDEARGGGHRPRHRARGRGHRAKAHGAHGGRSRRALREARARRRDRGDRRRLDASRRFARPGSRRCASSSAARWSARYASSSSRARWRRCRRRSGRRRRRRAELAQSSSSCCSRTGE